MPVYESELPHEEMQKVIDKGCVCLECGGLLLIAWGGFYGHNEYMLRCGNDAKHEGIARDASLGPYDIPGFNLFNLNKGRRKMTEEQVGKEVGTKLAKYMGVAAITKRMATDIVETLWGEAPIIEKTKCILLCQTYQLNPLMKHIYLIKYDRYKKLGEGKKEKIGEDWSIQIGIGATRLMAQRKHNYSYLDMTPRKATTVEIEKILGDTADSNTIYGFVHIKDQDSQAEAFGLRGIGKNESIKGEAKGNTHLNQACVRAERLALDRQYPGEMPQGVEVIDERYMEGEGLGNRKVDKDTGEIIEGEVRELPDADPEPKEHWCKEHNCAYELKKSRFGSFYAHKIKGGKWCNEKKKAEASKEEAGEPVPEPESQPELEPGVEPEKRDPSTIKTINELYKACHDDFKNAKGDGMQPAEVIAELGVSSQSDISDSPEECYRKIAAVR